MPAALRWAGLGSRPALVRHGAAAWARADITSRVRVGLPRLVSQEQAELAARMAAQRAAEGDDPYLNRDRSAAAAAAALRGVLHGTEPGLRGSATGAQQRAWIAAWGGAAQLPEPAWQCPCL
jgi:hypothetical protein